LSAIEERELGWLQQLRTTPLPSIGVVIARALLGVLAAIPPVVVVLATGVLVNHVHLSPGRWAACGVALVVGVIPFALLGVAIGYGVRTQLAQQLSMLLNLGLALVGGLWIPASNFPGALRAASGWTPTAAFASFARGTAGIRELAMADVARLGGWTVILLALAVLACVRAVRTR
jgi:ABC-2 type transport system permease protein